MFRKEELVKINGVLVSKNGFKNLTFETSKFSNSVSPLRGFGASIDENNLNIIDTLNIEFYIDASELKNIALIYSQFKVIGALPLENKYIIDKVKSSLLIENAPILFKNKEKLEKKITHIIVYLDNIRITSLEKTNNGFSVCMKLSLHKNAFDQLNYDNFRASYEEWNNKDTVNFEKICLNAINKEVDKIKKPSALVLNIYNIEKINAKSKSKALLRSDIVQSMMENDDFLDNKKERLENLIKYADLDTHYSLEIPEVHIAQIELISQNIIGSIPIKGQNVGIRSFMGIGLSFYNVKFIFDERDNELLSEIKRLSDKNINNHKIQILHPLVNMLDFHNATIKNMVFNNVEGSNGVVVTIQFQINGYNYFDQDETNYGNIGEVDVQKKIFDYSLIGSYMETCIEDMLKNKSVYLKANRYKTSDEIKKSKRFSNKDLNVYRKDKDIFDEKFYTNFLFLLSTVIEANKNVIYNYGKFGNFLSMYTSYITTFSSISDLNAMNSKNYFIYSRYDKDKNKFPGIYNLIKEKIEKLKLQKHVFVPDHSLYPSREFHFAEISSFYSYIDYISLATFLETEKVREYFDAENEYKVFENLEERLFVNLSNYIFSTKINGQSTIETLVDMSVNLEMYRKLYQALNKGTFSSIVEELKLETNLQGVKGTINFPIVFKYINKLIDAFFASMLKVTTDYKYQEIIIKRIKCSKKYMEEGLASDAHLKNVVSQRMDEIAKDISKIKDVSKNEISEYSYNIFLSKILYFLLEIMETQAADQEELFYLDVYLKSMIVASACFGFMSVKTRARTDNYGNIYKVTSDKLSNVIRTLLTTGYLAERDTNDFSFYGKYYKTLVKNSYWNQQIDWDSFTFDDNNSDVKESSDMNKDYNFIFGKKIENCFPEYFISDSLTTVEDEEAVETCSEFLTDVKKKFLYNEMESVEWHQLHKTHRHSPILCLPSFYSVMKDQNSTTSVISKVMKKRIIGNKDIFTDFEKVSDIINTDTVETIPDYEIIIKTNDYENKNSGIYKIFKLKATMGLNNVANISISKLSDTKIKVANISLIDINKEIIDYFDKDYYDILSTQNGTVDTVRLSPGNEIEIWLGFSSNKKNVYKGFVKTLIYQNNILNISCTDAAGGLYNYKFPDLEFKDIGALETAKNFINKVTMTTKKDDRLSETIRAQIINKLSNPNDHLFNVVDYPDNPKEMLNKPFKDGEYASFYNAFLTVLHKLPFPIVKMFEKDSDGGYKENLLIQNMNEYLDLHSSFTVFGKDKSASATTSFSSSFSVNINNVDVDYDTYGVKVMENDETIQLQMLSDAEIEAAKKEKEKRDKENKYIDEKGEKAVATKAEVVIEDKPLDEIMIVEKKSDKQKALEETSKNGSEIHPNMPLHPFMKDNVSLNIESEFAPNDYLNSKLQKTYEDFINGYNKDFYPKNQYTLPNKDNVNYNIPYPDARRVELTAPSEYLGGLDVIIPQEKFVDNPIKENIVETKMVHTMQSVYIDTPKQFISDKIDDTIDVGKDFLSKMVENRDRRIKWQKVWKEREKAADKERRKNEIASRKEMQEKIREMADAAGKAVIDPSSYEVMSEYGDFHGTQIDARLDEVDWVGLKNDAKETYRYLRNIDYKELLRGWEQAFYREMRACVNSFKNKLIEEYEGFKGGFSNFNINEVKQGSSKQKELEEEFKMTKNNPNNRSLLYNYVKEEEPILDENSDTYKAVIAEIEAQYQMPFADMVDKFCENAASAKKEPKEIRVEKAKNIIQLVLEEELNVNDNVYRVVRDFSGKETNTHRMKVIDDVLVTFSPKIPEEYSDDKSQERIKYLEDIIESGIDKFTKINGVPTSEVIKNAQKGFTPKRFNSSYEEREARMDSRTITIQQLGMVCARPTVCKNISSIYNEARGKGNKIRRHKGVDIYPVGNQSRNIIAPISGKLKASKKSGYGNTVELFSQKYDVKFLFAHLLSNNTALNGKEVKRGDVIGIIGNTGASTNTHLHMECSIRGKSVDPLEVFGLANFTYNWGLIGSTARRINSYIYGKEIDDYRRKVEETKRNKVNSKEIYDEYDFDLYLETENKKKSVKDSLLPSFAKEVKIKEIEKEYEKKLNNGADDEIVEAQEVPEKPKEELPEQKQPKEEVKPKAIEEPKPKAVEEKPEIKKEVKPVEKKKQDKPKKSKKMITPANLENAYMKPASGDIIAICGNQYVDIEGDLGEPILASHKGVIAHIGYYKEGNKSPSYAVVIDYQNGYIGYYQMLTGGKIKEGDKVECGDILGYLAPNFHDKGVLRYQMRPMDEFVDEPNVEDFDLEYNETMSVTTSESVVDYQNEYEEFTSMFSTKSNEED